MSMLKLIIRDASVPVIVDAGLRSPSDAALTMEIGGDAVLVNSAIAAAENPELMASAFAAAVRAGRDAWKAGLMPQAMWLWPPARSPGFSPVERPDERRACGLA